MSVNTRLHAVAELRCHGVKLAVHDHADDGATVVTGGLLVGARRRY